MTDQQYSDCQFEIHFDTVDGRTPGGAARCGGRALTWPRCLTTLPTQLNGIQHSDDALARRTHRSGESPREWNATARHPHSPP
jgi:hypothetical protein